MSNASVPDCFLDFDLIDRLSKLPEPSPSKVDDILEKALLLKGLDLDEMATLLAVHDEVSLNKLLETAFKVKTEIYGHRMVLFAPLYTGNHCSNNCLYCGFRRDNESLVRVKLSMEEIHEEAVALIKEGHKRILLLSGESGEYPLEYTRDAIETIYSARVGNGNIRRINVEIAPLSVPEFKELKECKIGTYACFQETYDPRLYKKYHPCGPKADYLNRLNVMHRAMEAGIDDVGVGILFGLADYKFEVIAAMCHAMDLEQKFGCGPHTVSVPRIEPAGGAPLSEHIPYPVSDEDFKKIIAIIRITLPYTGIILSTREKASLRKELFHYGVSQISAGSRTNPGGYAVEGEQAMESQFSLGDHRSLEEVIDGLVDDGYIPSFCTGCYRMGRVGNDFMDLAKPGLIKKFCMPNGMSSFAEYLEDYASPALQSKGKRLIDEMAEHEENCGVKRSVKKLVGEVQAGSRDVYI